jgi:lipid-A-disaccharide synthase
MQRSVFIVSGEESGDIHGSALIRALKRRLPFLKVAGMGGPRMRAEGLDGIDSKEVSVVGLTEVLPKLPVILRALKAIKKSLKERRPDAVVLIDFPDFNLRVGRLAKAMGLPVIYYISPQVWAWRKDRIKKIKAIVDKMLVVFPFEEGFYRDAGVDALYVGHPLAEIARCGKTRDEARKGMGIGLDETVISALPGSRTGEVRRLLPLMLEACGLIKKRLGRDVRFLLPAAESIDDGFLVGIIKGRGDALNLTVVRKRMHEALRASDAAMVASGTATLETALIGTPMVIVYRMSGVSYRIAKMLVDVEFIGLPNIVAGREICPELIQGQATPERISGEVARILNEKTVSEGMKAAFMEISERLSGGPASENAADAIFKIIGRADAQAIT